MNELRIINFSIPAGFVPKFDEFLQLVSDDKEFKEVLKKINSRYNKKRKNNKLVSAKLRFCIAEYVAKRKTVLHEEKEEKKKIKIEQESEIEEDDDR